MQNRKRGPLVGAGAGVSDRDQIQATNVVIPSKGYRRDSRRVFAVAAALAVLLPAMALAGPTPEQKCEGGKNAAAGKYDICAAKAEKGLVTKGDLTKYAKELVQCEKELVESWGELEADAVADGAVCPSTGDQAAIQNFVDACVQSVAVAVAGGALGSDPVTCAADLGTCTGSLGTCNGDLSTSNASLASCTGTLGTCSSDLGTCNGDLSTSNASLTSCTGTLGTCNSDLGTCNGDLGTCNSDLGTCNGDLSTSNASLASCTGTLGTCNSSLGTCNTNYSGCTASLATVNAGTAVVADVLAGKTFSSSAGVGVTGTATAGSNVTGGAGSLSMTIPDGFYSGSKTATANDADLLAANVKKGVNLFGTTGTLGSLPKTGQTQCSTGAIGNGAMGACPATVTGQDGDSQAGTARSYTANSVTITDNVTGLEWEKLCDQDPAGATCPADHDVDTVYPWVSAFTKVAAMNAAVYAGHNDWRLPNNFELESLRDMGRVSPSIDPVFNASCTAPCAATGCSCTLSGVYWSSTSVQVQPNSAWLVDFQNGIVTLDGKGVAHAVRAVRGGL